MAFFARSFQDWQQLRRGSDNCSGLSACLKFGENNSIQVLSKDKRWLGEPIGAVIVEGNSVDYLLSSADFADFIRSLAVTNFLRNREPILVIIGVGVE